MFTKTQLDDEVKFCNQEIEKWQNKLAALQVLREEPATVDGVKRRGRPPGIKTVKVEGEVKRRGRPPGKKAGLATTEGKLSLKELLKSIASKQNKPLTQAEFVTAAREAGYVTKSDDFSGMVYQCLNNLVNSKEFDKVVSEDKTRGYVVRANAA